MARHVVRRDATICPKSGANRKCRAHARNDVNDPSLPFDNQFCCNAQERFSRKGRGVVMCGGPGPEAV